VTSRFAAYDAAGSRHVVGEFVTVHHWSSSRVRQGSEWPGLRQFRLFDGTPVERECDDRYSFRDKAGRQVELSTEKPTA
jgi:hypothetical protein